jgi:methyl-accepting chemotaxis protein
MSEQIAGASKEQSTVIEEVSRNIEAISDVSVQTTQSMQDATINSQKVAKHVVGLHGMVADFVTG